MPSEASQSRPSASSGLSYHTAAYWETRFATDPREQSGFEWLSPSSSLLASLTSNPSILVSSPSIRILHIGVGTSQLSLDLIRYLRSSKKDWKDRARRIINVDFAEKSIEFQRRAEREFLQEIGEEEEELMQYAVLDLLSWQEVQAVLGEGELFDVVLDKSTTDSISTGDDVSFASISGTAHPALVQPATHRCASSKGVATTQVLGIHLGAIVKPGGLWLCHSYSSDRWDDVLVSSPDNAGAWSEQAWPWEQICRSPVPVSASDPNAPEINHYIYTMQRK